MSDVFELVRVCDRLNEANQFAVLVYARFQWARQEAQLCKPYAVERRSPLRVRFNAHYVGSRVKM